MDATIQHFFHMFSRLKKRDVFYAVFSLGLFLMPFVYWPTAQVPFEVPRVWFVLVWIYALVISQIVAMVLQKKGLRPLGGRFYSYLALLFLSAVVSSVFGSDLQKSIWGNYFRLDGLVTFFHLLLFSYLVAQNWKGGWTKTVAAVFSAASSIVSAYLLYLDLKYAAWGKDLAFTFGNPNFLAGYVLVGLPFSLYCLRNSKKKWRLVWIVSVALQVIAICSTKSWGAIIGLGVLACVYFQQTMQLKRWDLIGAALIAILIIFLGIFTRESLTYTGLEQTEGRERIFGKASIAFMQRPVLGWGWANFDHAYDAVDWKYHAVPDKYVDKAHSHILEYFVTTGVVGGLLYLIFLLDVVRGIDQKSVWNQTLFMVVILYIFHTQTNVISIAEEVIFWMVVGIVWGTARLTTKHG